MKVKLVAVAILIGCLTFNSPKTVLAVAPYQQAEQTYLSMLDTYRTNLTNYQTARQKFLDFNTLTAESGAINAGKTYLTSSINLITSYLDVLMEKANADASLSSSDKDYIVAFYQKDKAYYAGTTQAINAVSTAQDLISQSTDLNTHYQNDTTPAIPLIRSIITASDSSNYLDQIGQSLSNVSQLLANQSFLGKPTVDLVHSWISDTQDKANQSSSILKEITTDIRTYKDGGLNPDDQRHFLEKTNSNIKTLQSNLVNHANSLLEILGRLSSGN